MLLKQRKYNEWSNFRSKRTLRSINGWASWTLFERRIKTRYQPYWKQWAIHKGYEHISKQDEKKDLIKNLVSSIVCELKIEKRFQNNDKSIGNHSVRRNRISIVNRRIFNVWLWSNELIIKEERQLLILCFLILLIRTDMIKSWVQYQDSGGP